MTALGIVVARWNDSPLDFFITAAMPFFILAGMWAVCLLRRVRLPGVFYPLSIFCSLAGLLYAPGCLCMGTEQTIGTTIIALVVSAIFFVPVAFGYVLSTFDIFRKHFALSLAPILVLGIALAVFLLWFYARIYG
jgi:hypothetical protein